MSAATLAPVHLLCVSGALGELGSGRRASAVAQPQGMACWWTPAKGADGATCQAAGARTAAAMRAPLLEMTCPESAPARDAIQLTFSCPHTPEWEDAGKGSPAAPTAAAEQIHQ